MLLLSKLSSCFCILYLMIFIYQHCCTAQKTCPSCGSMAIPYPLSTNPQCGDPQYSLQCDQASHKLYFNSLNRNSYSVIRIMADARRIVVQPSPWVGATCVTKDAELSEGIWLNQSLPFNITSSNTVFLLGCSPRLLGSPLNCTPSSLCHSYLDSSGHIEKNRAARCVMNGLDPCCTFLAGGMPSAYKIRLHSSGCQAFRSILHLDPHKPPSKWEEGLEIQWAPPPEPLCNSQLDCSRVSKCSPTSSNGSVVSRCLCKRDYYWDQQGLATCSRSRNKLYRRSDLTIELPVAISGFLLLGLMLVCVIALTRSRKLSNKARRLAKARESMWKSSNGGKSARMFGLKEVKKATDNFSPNRVLGSGGFGEVYKGELSDGTIVAVKSAKVGNIKSTQQVLNEVEILSQVNHKNLVKLLGCCVEAEQPLMIYEYIANGTLHDHLHGKVSTSFLDWKTRLRIALQTAEALAYLHSGTYNPIYHRDVKSTNILLDEEFNAKVADFGLSRLTRPGLSHVSTCAQGTLGYLDPEYYRNYQLTDKSDVYSFGVVLLELLTSKRAIDFSRDQDDVNLAMFVTQRARSGALMGVIDRRVLGEEEPALYMLTSIRVFSELAFACLREKKQERPTMKDAVEELQAIIRTLIRSEEAPTNDEVDIEINGV